MAMDFTPTNIPAGYNTASQDKSVNATKADYISDHVNDYFVPLKTYLLWNGVNNYFTSFVSALMSSNIFSIAAYANPIDSIVQCCYVPFLPVGYTAAEPIKIGNTVISPDAVAPAVTRAIGYVKCGSFTYASKKYYDNFLDYSPYTKASIYLPYIGWRDVDASIFYDDGRRDSYGSLMWDYLDIYYAFNVITGALVASIYGRRMRIIPETNPPQQEMVSNILLYQFTGNGAETIPLTQNQAVTKAQSIMTCVASSVGGAAGVAAGIASGNPMLAVGAAGTALAGIAGGVMKGANPNADLTTHGTISGEFGTLMPTKIYLLMKIPKQVMPEYMNQTEGITSNVGKLMSQLTNSGFNALSTFHLDGFSCLDDEKEELAALFRAGCIF